LPVAELLSSICVSIAIATLSGMFELHTVKPVKPKPFVPTTADSTPTIPPAAFGGGVPLPVPVVRPGTNPAMRKCCQNRLDSAVFAGAPPVPPVSLSLYLFATAMTPSPSPDAGAWTVQRVVAFLSSPGMAR